MSATEEVWSKNHTRVRESEVAQKIGWRNRHENNIACVFPELSFSLRVHVLLNLTIFLLLYYDSSLIATPIASRHAKTKKVVYFHPFAGHSR